jgi:hypothetical protein
LVVTGRGGVGGGGYLLYTNGSLKFLLDYSSQDYLTMYVGILSKQAPETQSRFASTLASHFS